MDDDPSLDYARGHMWQGRKLHTIDHDELIEILAALNACCPVSYRVPVPNSRDSLIVHIWRLDRVLERMRPLGITGKERGPTGGQLSKAYRDFWAQE